MSINACRGDGVVGMRCLSICGSCHQLISEKPKEIKKAVEQNTQIKKLIGDKELEIAVLRILDMDCNLLSVDVLSEICIIYIG